MKASETPLVPQPAQQQQPQPPTRSSSVIEVSVSIISEEGYVFYVLTFTNFLFAGSCTCSTVRLDK